jgi:hypothetical protein
VARPPRAVIFRGDEVEFNGRCGETPARCVLVVATARQPVERSRFGGLIRQVECGVAAAPRRRIPHGGGLLGVVQYASVGFLSTQGYAAGFGDYVSVIVGGCRVR